MRIQINLQVTTVPEMKAVELVLMRGKIYTANTMKIEKPKQWSLPLRAKTVMGVEGSTCIYMTEAYDYLGRGLERIIRMAHNL